MYLTEGISNIEIKKIFQNRENKEAYLKRLFQEIGSEEEIAKSNPKIDEQIINTWNYEVSKKVIRDLFSETEKYKYIKGCKKAVDKAIKDWKSLHLGEFDWPFGAMNFDQHVHQLNRRDDISEEEKDQILAQETIKFNLEFRKGILFVRIENTINKRDLEVYFPEQRLQFVVKQPLEKLNVADKYDIKVNLNGGGFTGQAEALRLAIARALVEINPEDKAALKKA